MSGKNRVLLVKQDCLTGEDEESKPRNGKRLHRKMAEIKPTDPEIKLLQASLLLDAYGELLTGRQRQFMRLHFEDDLSFSQIARDFKISRQAVHDSVKHAVHTLENLERTLHLVEKAQGEAEAAETHIGGRQLIERLARIRDQVRANPDRINAEWVAGELDDLIGLLKGEQPKEQKAEN